MDERGFMRHLDDLKQSYKETLKDWRKRREAVREQIQARTTVPLDELKKKKFREERHRLREELPELYVQLREIGEIIGSLEYVIEWLEKGKNPNLSRGIERRSVYQRTVFMDPSIMERYMRPTNSRSASTLTEEQRDKLRDVLEILSPRERECYEMHFGDGLPHSKIAELLNIPRANVGEYVKRAHEKVSRGWQGTLF